MKRIAVFVINLYKIFFSPIFVFLFGNGCRYVPTCSEYSKQAIIIHGVLKGSKLSLQRVIRCHPFSTHSGINDPVPLN